MSEEVDMLKVISEGAKNIEVTTLIAFSQRYQNMRGYLINSLVFTIG